MISLLVFFLFFTGVTWFVFATPKKQMQQIAHIPLEQ
jgi:cbb3-type cytochrome oxidase subunit 3